jgi:NitT/TauT family transport system permease protein
VVTSQRLPSNPRELPAPRPRSYPVDFGLLTVLAVVVLAVVFGSSFVRPYDSPVVDPRAWLLPVYLLRSLARMIVAYGAAVLLALATGHLAAASPVARRIILPTLDVLQSVPILGFFPAAVAVFVGLFGESALGVEAAAIFLIFTSMFWNLAFGVYGSLITVPEDLTLAARQLGLRGSMRWSRLVLPAVFPNLVYNSILSWANGWYFLIASEIIAAGPARYTLPGLGSYLSQALVTGHTGQTLMAMATLLVATLGLHLLVWSPLELWAERFQLGETGERPRTPRIGRLLARSRLVRWTSRELVIPAGQRAISAGGWLMALPGRAGRPLGVVVALTLVALTVYGVRQGYALFLARPLPPAAYDIPAALVLSFLRVSAGVLLAVFISIPLAYAASRLGVHGRGLVLSALQILGSFPATAFFPLIAFAMTRLGVGMDVGAVFLILTTTFFYVMFNALAGAVSVPEEMNEAATVLSLRGTRYLRRVFVPAILPRLVTGCVTAWGAAWNAIILSEYVVTRGKLYAVRGIGAILDHATYVTGDKQVVTLSLAAMVTLIIIVNRVFWEPLYRAVAERYKMEA